MASYLREPSDATCWNCDRHTDDLVAVTLRAPTGATRAFALCRACDDAIYEVLVRIPVDAGLEVVRGAPGLRAVG